MRTPELTGTSVLFPAAVMLAGVALSACGGNAERNASVDCTTDPKGKTSITLPVSALDVEVGEEAAIGDGVLEGRRRLAI